MDQNKESITAKKSENFSEWYSQVLLKSGFIDQSLVSGSLIFLPTSYFIWETMMRVVDSEFRKNGIEDVYFPLLIPERLLKKEADHFKGFTPEVAWVTHAGDTKLDERLAIRPTSETIMYESYSKWIRSWRDLPLRFNQWNNVLRWEFRHPTPFIRTREFLWNEGHTVFATEKEARAERDFVLGVYNKVLKEYLALPGITGRKSDKEKFAGAVESYSVEHILPDGWALQGPDWHFDGQNFAKAFEIKFLDEKGEKKYAWQNTFAISTRELGVMVATHGDDKGLILPPNIAYIQVVIIPIFKKENESQVKTFAEKIYKTVKDDYRTKLDDREGYSPGNKFNEWEMRGVPLRIEAGEREMKSNKVILVRRDKGTKKEVGIDSVVKEIKRELEDIQEFLYKRAEEFLKSQIHEVKDYALFKKILKEKGGILHTPWCGMQECEDKIKEETSAKITNIPLDQKKLSGKCVYCGMKAKYMANFARSY